MGVVKKRVTLVTGPKIIEDVQKEHKPLLDEKNRLSQQEVEDHKLLKEVLKDPYADLPPHSSPSLMEIREWVRKRDEKKAPIEKRVSERKKRLGEINARLSPGQKQVRDVQRHLEQRKQSLSKAREKREQRVRFANNLAEPQVMSEFIEVKSEQIRDLLRERGIKSSGWDEFDQERARNKTREKESSAGRSRPWSQREVAAPAIRASRLSSIKTMAGVYGQLCREKGYTPEKSVLDGLERVFKAARIRDVLEVGPGSRGVVCILQDLGLAEKLGLNLAAVDLLDKPSVVGDYVKRGIDHKVGDARDVEKIFPGRKFDLILAVGVLSGGGIQAGEHSMREVVDQAHDVSSSLKNVLSENPHTLFAASSLHGTLALFKDRLEKDYEIVFSKPPSYEATEVDKQRRLQNAPYPLDYIRGSARRDHIREYMDWCDENNDELDFAEELSKQSTDLIILKRKKQ